jgi:hypothetical protein
MAINTTRDPVLDLTIHVVTGPAFEEEMYAALEGDGPDDQTTLRLWDMSAAEVSHVTPGILRRFIKRAADLGKSREGGRTAVVARNDLAYGLARMSEAFVDFTSSPYQFRAFRTQADALLWLKSEDNNNQG